MKNKILAQIRCVFIGLLSVSCMVGQVAAETYDVNAVVPYATPSQAAVIHTPVSGATVSSALQQVSGSCENIAPPAVVSIWRDAHILGSVNCSSGSFQLTVQLLPGQNNLIARTSNANGIFGSDSTVTGVTYTAPVVVTPLSPGLLVPTNPSQQEAAANAGSQTGLTLTTLEPFSVITSNNATVTIRVIIAGGENPYDLTLNWGDGSTETKKIDKAGTYEFTHAYHTQKGYTVYVRVRDVRGVYTEYVYAVVSTMSGQAERGSSGGKSKQTQDMLKEHNFLWYGLVVVAVAILLIAVSTYRLGYRRAQKRFEQAMKSSRRMAAAGKRRRRKDDA